MSQVSRWERDDLREMARFMTEHHIGTVFESASGMRLPDRVESTSTRLRRVVMGIKIAKDRVNYLPVVLSDERQ